MSAYYQPTATSDNGYLYIIVCEVQKITKIGLVNGRYVPNVRLCILCSIIFYNICTG